jgi:hypothetical protein
MAAQDAAQDPVGRQGDVAQAAPKAARLRPLAGRKQPMTLPCGRCGRAWLGPGQRCGLCGSRQCEE